MDRSLAPGFARSTYTGVGGVHHMITPINLQAGWVSGENPDVMLKSGDLLDAEAAIQAFLEVYALLLATSQHIGLVEIYAVDPGTGEGTFVYGWDAAVTGTGPGGSAVPKVGTQITYKLVNGRTYRLLAMENDIGQDVNQYPPFGVGSPQAVISGFVCGADSPVYGRGNAYPFAPMRLVTKEYDALRKRTGL